MPRKKSPKELLDIKHTNMIKKQLEQLPIIEKHLLRMKKQVKKGNDLTTHQLWSLYKQEKDRIESVYYNSSYKNYDEKEEKQTRFEDKKASTMKSNKPKL